MRNLLAQPTITDILLCGKDMTGSGAALAALLQEGVDEGGRIVGEGTRLHGEIPREAVELLEPISRIGARPSYPRSALVHSAYLAKAHLMRGDLEQMITAMRWAIARLGEVQSPRGRTYLRQLRPALLRRKRSQVVADFLPELDEALSMA